MATTDALPLLPGERAALDAFATRIRELFGPRLRELALFGSRARGEGDENSDVDVLVVVDELTGEEARATAYAAGDAMTEYDVLVSPFVVATSHIERLRSRERSIALEIARDAIPL